MLQLFFEKIFWNYRLDPLSVHDAFCLYGHRLVHCRLKGTRNHSPVQYLDCQLASDSSEGMNQRGVRELGDRNKNYAQWEWGTGAVASDVLHLLSISLSIQSKMEGWSPTTTEKRTDLELGVGVCHQLLWGCPYLVVQRINVG